MLRKQNFNERFAKFCMSRMCSAFYESVTNISWHWHVKYTYTNAHTHSHLHVYKRRIITPAARFLPRRKFSQAPHARTGPSRLGCSKRMSFVLVIVLRGFRGAWEKGWKDRRKNKLTVRDSMSMGERKDFSIRRRDYHFWGGHPNVSCNSYPLHWTIVRLITILIMHISLHLHSAKSRDSSFRRSVMPSC